MLNIPYEVQQALRKGDMRKNYRFLVQGELFRDWSVFNAIDHVPQRNEPSANLFIIRNALRYEFSIEVQDPSTYKLYARNYSYTDFSVVQKSTANTWRYRSLNGYAEIAVYSQTGELAQVKVKVVYNNVAINNDYLVSESVKIDERMVTGKELKFGLCEGSSLEFQYFEIPNINGKEIQAFLDVEYIKANGQIDWYAIPMGWYTVDQCPMQWETGIYKVTAYNKLKSKYLDQKANKLVIEAVTEGTLGKAGQLDIGLTLSHLLDDFTIFSKYSNAEINTISSAVEGYAQYRQVDAQGVAQDQILGYIRSYVRINLSDFDSTKKYRLWANPKKIYEEILSYIPSALLSNIYKSYDYGQYTPKTLREHIQNYENSADIELAFRIYTASSDVASIKINSDNNQTQTSLFTPWATDLRSDGTGQIMVWLPTYWKTETLSPDYAMPSLSTMFSAYEKSVAQLRLTDILNDPECFLIQEVDEDGLDAIEWTIADAEALPDVTLRELQSAVYESQCLYGQLNRETDLFEGVELNQSGLYPAETLYPDNALYPLGTMEHPFPSTYSKLWTDTVGEQSFRYLIITYKAMENGQEVEKTLQRTVNADGTTNYNMSDNWLFRNLVWTAADVGDYADAMVLKMKDIRWFPFEMWCAGLPYVETGDAIEITDRQGDTHTSYVLTRTLDGIHNLQDTFINGELDIF